MGRGAGGSRAGDEARSLQQRNAAVEGIGEVARGREDRRGKGQGGAAGDQSCGTAGSAAGARDGIAGRRAACNEVARTKSDRSKSTRTKSARTESDRSKTDRPTSRRDADDGRGLSGTGSKVHWGREVCRSGSGAQ